MPPINIYACKTCRIKFHVGWGGYRYVETNDGQRKECAHPIEDAEIAKTLGLTYDEVCEIRWKKPAWWWSNKRRKRYEEIAQLIEERTGYNSLCICLNCKKPAYLDLGDAETAKASWRYHYGAVKHKDKRQCPDCGDLEIMSLFEMLGKPCPLCGRGRVEEIVTGREA
jgi:hypothetical protein